MIDPTKPRPNIFNKFLTFDKPVPAQDPPLASPGVTTKMPQVVRTMGDNSGPVNAEAARIYNPTLPPMAPSPAAPLPPVSMAPDQVKAPPKTMFNQGTASTLDMQGRWGAPAAKGE